MISKNILLLAIIFCLPLASFAQDKTPLPVPEGFNPELNLIGSEVQGVTYHRVYVNAQHVQKLLDNGTPEDIALAEKIIPALITCQDLNPQSANYGGFKWEVETPMVDDLNAVEFLLDGLIPMMVKNESKLSPEIASQLRESIRLALQNVDRVDVHYKYTNIILKDITNSCLGGELLGDTAIANRGYRRMREWMAFTDAQGGGVYEYNALPYTAVALDVLSKLENLVENEETRVLAKIALARLSVSTGLHLHNTTRRWAGPHGRAYHKSYISQDGWYKLKEEEMETIEDWTAEGILPSWISATMTPDMVPDQIVETVGLDEGISISTYKTEPYAFGVASRNMFNQDNRYIAWQSNVFSLVYDKPKDQLPGIIYTRYINNDEWLGDFSAGPGRPTDMLIPDKGHFQGVQDENRAIGLYVPRHLNAMDNYTSAKSVIALPRWNNQIDRVWVDEQLIENFPTEVKQGATVVIESGEIFIAIKPFKLTSLGIGDKMLIREMNDEDRTLVFEMYNYQGPAKTFWELAWPGAFYQGMPQNGWYTEIARQSEYADGAAFAKVVNSGTITDMADPRFTWTGSEERKWKVEYARAGRKLGMEVDLFDWFRPATKWNQAGEIGFPMMQSKYAVQNMEGKITVGDVQLTCAKEPAWLFVSKDQKTIVAAIHGTTKAPFTLTLPKGSVKIPVLRSGLVVIENGQVTIDALEMEGQPELSKLKLKKK